MVNSPMLFKIGTTDIRVRQLNLFCLKSQIKGRGPEKTRKKSGLFQTGGGSRRVVKNQTSILEKYFFSEHIESF